MNELIKWFLLGIITLLFSYVALRILAKAFFKSFYEAKFAAHSTKAKEE